MSPEDDEFSSLVRNVKQAWETKDTARDELEQQAQQIFAQIDDYLKRMNQALHAVGAIVQIDTKWQSMADQTLHRVAKVTSTKLSQQLNLDFTTQGSRIFYHSKSYQCPNEIDALKQDINHEVERFLKPPTVRRHNQGLA